MVASNGTFLNKTFKAKSSRRLQLNVGHFCSEHLFICTDNKWKKTKVYFFWGTNIVYMQNISQETLERKNIVFVNTWFLSFPHCVCLPVYFTPPRSPSNAAHM